MKALTKEEATGQFQELEDFAKKFAPQPKTKLVATADCSVSGGAYNVSCTPVAIAEECCPPVTANDISYLSARIDSIRQDYWRLWEELYTHKTEGHIPKIIGAEKMNAALKALKMDGDYKVEPKVVYASDGQPSEVTLSFKVNG